MLLLLLVGSAYAASPIVQSMPASANAASLTFNLPATPAAGDLLVVGIGYNVGADPFNPPNDGTWTAILESPTAHTAVKVWWRLATSSSGSSFTFTGSGADALGGAIYELTAPATTPVINGYASNQDSTAAPSTGSVTPTVLGCVALAFITSNNARQATSVSSGWTLDKYAAAGSYHDLQTAILPATTDTTTPVSATFAEPSGSESAQAIILIAPGAAPATPPPTAAPSSKALFFVARNEPPHRRSR